MGDNSEHMEVNAGENIETEYFQEITSYNGSLDRSIDSFQGNLTLPTFNFSLGQSTELQESRGFQVVGSQNEPFLNTFSRSDDVEFKNATRFDTHTSEQNEYTEMKPSSPAFHVDNSLDPYANSGFDTTIKTESNIYVLPNMFNVVSVANNADSNQFPMFSDNSGNTYTFGGVRMDGGFVPATSSCSGIHDNQNDYRDNTKSGDLGETGSTSSDEKSGKCKMSPKRKGRKSRSTSSTGNEVTPKLEPRAGPSPSRVEMCTDLQAGGDVGFKPSLLDEILTEKKLALMRSPEVIRFLQSQQDRLVREKKVSCGQSSDS